MLRLCLRSRRQETITAPKAAIGASAGLLGLRIELKHSIAVA